MGVHRRVDIYSIESAGIEYSIDMKVNIAVLQYNLSYLNPSVVNSKTSPSKAVSGPNAWQRIIQVCFHLEAIFGLSQMLDVDTFACQTFTFEADGRTAEFITIVAFQAKPNCLIFLDNDTVVVGGESKEAQVISQVCCGDLK